MYEEKEYLKERVNHGDKTFPLCVYYNKRNDNSSHILGYHWHNEVEFIYLSKGDVIFYVDTTPIEVHEGEAIFVNSGQIHSGYLNYSLNCEFYSIVFDLNMLSSNTIGESQNIYITPIINKKYSLPQKYSLNTQWGTDVINRLKIIIKSYLCAIPAREIVIIASLYEIISQIIINGKLEMNNQPDIIVNKYKKERFKDVLNYIHQNYRSHISIIDMASQINMSQFHFCRFFKSMSGKTPFEYLNNYRINQAVLLLCNSDKKIMEIALDVGFTNFSYFIKTFKQFKGCTPSKFRNPSK